MKRSTPTPDLFTGQPITTSVPKFTPALPTTPVELAQVQAQLRETAPRHVQGVVRGEDCVYFDACWQPIAKLAPADLVLCFSLQ